MTWLFAGLFVATFAAVAVASFKLNRDASRTAERELLQAAAQLGLVEEPRKGWSGVRIFRGSVNGIELSWTIVPKRGGRTMVLRARHPTLRGRTIASELAEFPDFASLKCNDDFVELTFVDNLGIDASQLIPSSQRLLTLATSRLAPTKPASTRAG